MLDYVVQPIRKEETHEWLLYKHYAHRIPLISFAFGLFKENILIGVITFGPPCRAYNNGQHVFHSYRVKTLELNRLCINNDLIKNSLSFFVASSLKLLPSPCCIVSYSDHLEGHHGYIYQATNWLYTGLSIIHDKEFIINGEKTHSRSLTSKGITAPQKWAKEKGIEMTQYGKKHRYFMFLGDKRERKEMKKDFKFEIKPYPKGDNKRYDASYQPKTQVSLF